MNAMKNQRGLTREEKKETSKRHRQNNRKASNL